jgi:hypothetical protein
MAVTGKSQFRRSAGCPDFLLSGRDRPTAYCIGAYWALSRQIGLGRVKMPSPDRKCWTLFVIDGRARGIVTFAIW